MLAPRYSNYVATGGIKFEMTCKFENIFLYWTLSCQVYKISLWGTEFEYGMTKWRFRIGKNI